MPGPGSIRELRNAIERAVLLCDGDEIDCRHLPATKAERTLPPPSRTVSLGPPRHEPPLDTEMNGGRTEDGERLRVVRALASCAGNQTQAAKLLGISRRTLVTRLDAYGLPRPRKPPR